VDNSLGVVLAHGKRWFGLVAASPFSATRWPMVALLGGSLAKTRGKTMSWWSDDAPHPDGRAWEAANRRGDGESGC
jgi:hypothetical protein